MVTEVLVDWSAHSRFSFKIKLLFPAAFFGNVSRSGDGGGGGGYITNLPPGVAPSLSGIVSQCAFEPSRAQDSCDVSTLHPEGKSLFVFEVVLPP